MGYSWTVWCNWKVDEILMFVTKQIGYMPGYGLNSPYTFTKQFPIKAALSVDTIKYDPDADFKILLQSEPPNLYIKFCSMVLENYQNFDLILTYDDRLLHLPNAMEFCPVGSWIGNDCVLDKKDEISFLMSSKINGEAYRMRFLIMYKYQQEKRIGPFDFRFFRSPPRVPSKNIFFQHAKFNVACENQIMTNMFTEKLLDCFKTYTVPLYYGCTNIEKYFNPKGIIKFNSFDEFNDIVNLTPSVYNDMLPYLHENYELGRPYWEKNIYQRIEEIIEDKINEKINNHNLFMDIVLD